MLTGWGLVCGDGWSLFEAMVVCRQLGLGYAQHAVQTDFFGGNRSELALSGVNCRGGESSLAQCFHDRYGEIDCPGRGENIAAVVCVPGAIPIQIFRWHYLFLFNYLFILIEFDWLFIFISINYLFWFS